MDYKHIQAIVNKHDPLRLLAIGCPKDEYDSEIKDVVRLLKESHNEEQITASLLEVFVKWFGKDLIRDREKIQLKKIATDINKLSS